MINWAINFRIFMWISSYRVEVLVFRVLIILLVSYVVAFFQLIRRNVILNLLVYNMEVFTLSLGSLFSFYIADNRVSNIYETFIKSVVNFLRIIRQCVIILKNLISFRQLDKINQLDVTFCIFYFSSSSCSTCFGQPCAHHQELTTA